MTDNSPRLGGQSDVTGREPLTREGVKQYWAAHIAKLMAESMTGLVEWQRRFVKAVNFAADRPPSVREMYEAGDILGAQRLILDKLNKEHDE